jgi:uncharacterized protein
MQQRFMPHRVALWMLITTSRRTFMPRASTVAIAMATLMIASSTADAARFCQKARHADERTVCRTPGMVRVDRHMNREYQQLMSELGFFGRARLQARQREWLAERRDCGNNPTCVRLAYRERLQTFRSIARRKGIVLDE